MLAEQGGAVWPLAPQSLHLGAPISEANHLLMKGHFAEENAEDCFVFGKTSRVLKGDINKLFARMEGLFEVNDNETVVG